MQRQSQFTKFVYHKQGPKRNVPISDYICVRHARFLKAQLQLRTSIICTSVYNSGYNVHSNIPYQIVEAFEMMIVTILSAAVKCQWDLKPYQEAMITTVTLNLM